MQILQIVESECSRFTRSLGNFFGSQDHISDKIRNCRPGYPCSVYLTGELEDELHVQSHLVYSVFSECLKQLHIWSPMNKMST